MLSTTFEDAHDARATAQAFLPQASPVSSVALRGGAANDNRFPTAPRLREIVGRPVRVDAPPRPAFAHRALDIFGALTAAAFFLPAILLVIMAIMIDDGGPILYSQMRIGRSGKPFRCYKFRSMVTDADSRLAALLASDEALACEWRTYRKLRRDPRNTRIGRFIRACSLDELPQLYNILKGDMSLVGPRPILASEVPLYGRSFRYYMAVRPGLTGLWQVSGRNHLTFRRRVAMDRVYARGFSFTFYMGVILATAPAVLFRRGSY